MVVVPLDQEDAPGALKSSRKARIHPHQIKRSRGSPSPPSPPPWGGVEQTSPQEGHPTAGRGAGTRKTPWRPFRATGHLPPCATPAPPATQLLPTAHREAMDNRGEGASRGWSGG